jgi:hypothetical protein
MQSPFDPSKSAWLEPVEQPLYSSFSLVVATPARRLSFWPIPSASLSDPTLTNMVLAQLANPKLFIVRGWRLHVEQSVALSDATTTLAQADGLVAFAEGYYYEFKVGGSKSYLQVPVFAMASGFGVDLRVSTTVNNVNAYTATLGQPLQENYRKLRRNEITIPPQQEFSAECIMQNTAISTFNGSNRQVWNFLEGTLGREVQ